MESLELACSAFDHCYPSTALRISTLASSASWLAISTSTFANKNVLQSSNDKQHGSHNLKPA